LPTLSELLIALTKLPGLEAERFTTGVQAAPPSGAYVGVAAGADATRQIVTTDLAKLDVSGSGTDTDASWYQGAYLHLPTLGLQRRVAQDGYSANEAASTATDQAGSSDRVAVLTLERTLGTTVAASLAAELHTPLPPMYDADRKTSLRSWLNRALSVLRMPARITLTGVANAYRYSLAAYPWLAHEGDLIRVSDQEHYSDQDPYVLPGRSLIRFDAGVPYLTVQAPVTAGASFYLDVFRPLSTWIAVTAAGTASLTADAVTSVTVSRGGSYLTAPTVTFSGGGGTGAAGTAVLAGGTVTSVTVTSGGSGYTTAPTVTFSDGAFASSTVGLVNLSDQSRGKAEDIALLAYYFACDELQHRHGSGTDLQWAERRARVASSVAPFLAWGQQEGPQVRRTDQGVWGDHPTFLARREGGRARRWG
jgi:hypothetical protein